MTGSYEERVRQQVDQYAETDDIHDLPKIFHLWSHNYILPGLKDVFAVEGVEDFYTAAFRLAKSRSPGGSARRVFSVGCGDGTIEINIAKRLLESGERDFTIIGADISPLLLDRFEKQAQAHAVREYCIPHLSDLNDIHLDGMFDLVIANHALHHIVGLERLFEAVHAAMHGGSVFATIDMIGRNGHMRWPETAVMVEALWPLLKPAQRYHRQLSRQSDRFIDHDCSTSGFEGIRAEDILPLMLKVFHPLKFLGIGGFIDILVDRGYGPGFDPADDRDAAVIRLAADLNDIMLDGGMIKPTIMFGYFVKEGREESYYRARSALASVRIPSDDPPWTHYHHFQRPIAPPPEDSEQGHPRAEGGPRSDPERNPQRKEKRRREKRRRKPKGVKWLRFFGLGDRKKREQQASGQENRALKRRRVGASGRRNRRDRT